MYNPLENGEIIFIPEQIALRKDIRGVSKFVYCLLFKEGAEIKSISETLDISNRDVHKAIAELKNKGVIKECGVDKNTLIDQRVLESKNLSPVSKLIINFLSDQDIYNGVKITAGDIAKSIGCSHKQVKKAISDLKQYGLLMVKSGKYPVYFLQKVIFYATPT